MDDAIDPEVAATARGIAEMEIRGAATIAREAALALKRQAEATDAESPAAFRESLFAAARRLDATRPTAVSLPNALRAVLGEMAGESVADLRASVVAAADAFVADLDDARTHLGRVGANGLADGDTLLTHCHSTDAMACVEAAVDDGKRLSAVVKETRPLMQGHVTAERLRDLGVPVTLVVDSAVWRFLDDVDHVLVGADSLAADGSVVNKVGTAPLAVAARERGVPVTVCARTIKLHPGTLRGEPVPVEERDPDEVLADPDRSALDVEVANPAFDVTPPRYIDAVVTERGRFPPEGLVGLMREEFGDDVTDPWERAEGERATDDGGRRARGDDRRRD